MSTNNQGKPVTLRQIAAQAGVSAAAVSLALRNSSQTSLKLREQIKRIANDLGYRPNPLLSAYQAQVRSLKAPKFHAALGWVSDHPNANVWSDPWNLPLIQGARTRAQTLGYTLDEIWIPDVREDDSEGNVQRLQKILRSRGIYGVVLPLLNRAHHAVQRWDGFAVACVGRHRLNLEKSRVPISELVEHHMVNEDVYANTRLALQKLRAGGCRRVGLVLSRWADWNADGLCSAAFLRDTMEYSAKERVPILFDDQHTDICEWVIKHAPDGVICGHPQVRHAIEMAGRKVPGDLRLAHLNLAPDVDGWSGIDRRLGDMGSAVIDLLTAHLIRNERGVPPIPKEVLIGGVWVDGNT